MNNLKKLATKNYFRDRNKRKSSVCIVQSIAKSSFFLLIFSLFFVGAQAQLSISEATSGSFTGTDLAYSPNRQRPATPFGSERMASMMESSSWGFDLTPPYDDEQQLVGEETLPAGSLIIAMDNVLQGTDTRLRQAYGLAVRLLHAGIPLKWIINPNKTIRTGIDFSATARIRYGNGSISTYANRDFLTGPIAIFPGYEAQAQTVINSFGNGIRVYELQSATTVNVHSNLTHKPFVFVESSEKPEIHTSILIAAGLASGTHYTTGNLTTVTATSCVTIITVPHNGSITNAHRTAVRSFLQGGGNFLAQCAAVRGFQATATRVFLNAGFKDNPGLGTFAYSNPTEPSAQFQGNIDDQKGSIVNFGFDTEPPGGTRIVHGINTQANNYKAYTGRIDGVTTSDGGYVHYLGGHDHKGEINADRYYLNAVLRSATRPSNCNLCINPRIDLAVSDPTICNGQSASITITASESGVSYQLRLDSDDSNVGTPIVGTGGNINFNVSPSSTTVYNILASRSGCSVELTDKATVTVNPLPTANLAITSTTICEGATAEITLSNTQTGVDYQLRLNSDNSNVGTAVAGNGGNITFSVSPASTTIYNVLATDATTNCPVQVTNLSTVTVIICSINVTDPVLEPACIDDAPFLNYELTSNFDPTGKKLTIKWQRSGNTTGIEDMLPGATPIDEVIREIDPIPASMVTDNGDGTWTLTGVDLWPGAVLDINDNIIDWPGWVFEGGVWLFKEDGFGQYRNGPIITFSINPEVVSDPVIYPQTTPGCSSNPPNISITGKVFNDTDGLTNSKVDGEDYSNEDIQALLINSDNKVAGISPIAADGTFSFSTVGDGTFSVLITNVAVSLGDDAPAVVLPSGWVVTGEDCCDDMGDDGTPNGILTGIVVSGTSITNVHFGIQQPPIAGSGANDAKNPGGDEQVEVPANTFTNTTASSDVAPGTVTSIRITAFPTGASSIVIDGIAYYPTVDDVPDPVDCDFASCVVWPAGGVTVATDGNGAPTVPVSVDPTDPGITQIIIPFVAIDNAGFESANEGEAILNLTPYPDLSPTIIMPSNTFNPNEIKNALLFAAEVNNMSTEPGVSSYGLTVPSGYVILAYDGKLEEMTPSGGGNTAVNNKEFEVISSSSTQIIFRAKAGVAISASGIKVLGVQVQRTTALAGSVSNMTVGVLPDPTFQYDSNNLNNNFSRILNAQ